MRKLESLLNHDSLIDDEAIDDTRPFDPMNEKPCDRLERKRDELNVDEAVENRPAENPMVVPVAL